MPRHPNQQIRNKGSLENQAMTDPALKRLIAEGRRKARVDAQVMELWAGADFQSRGLTPSDNRVSLEVEVNDEV